VVKKMAARPIGKRIMNVINDKDYDSKIQDCKARADGAQDGIGEGAARTGDVV
jgi:hypothetical protein